MDPLLKDEPWEWGDYCRMSTWYRHEDQVVIEGRYLKKDEMIVEGYRYGTWIKIKLLSKDDV